MVLYKGYCRPLGKKVDFTVEDVISMNTKRGIKWRVKGKFEDYNISTFCSKEIAQELLSKLPLKMDAEIAYTPPPTTYEAEELIPSFSNNSKPSEPLIITYEAEELVPYTIKKSKAEDSLVVHEQIQENTNAQELKLQSEKLPAKYYKKDGSLDMRYTVCREFEAKQAESQNAVELQAPYTPIEPERPSDDYGGGGRHRKKPRRPLGAEEKCDICAEGPIYEKDVNIEDYDDPIQVCQSCFDDTFTDIAAESFEAERIKQNIIPKRLKGKRVFVVSSVDYETDGEDVDLPQNFTFILDEHDTALLDGSKDMQEIADLLVDNISDETGWLVQGFYFQERMPDGTLVDLDAESFEAAYTPEQRLDDYTTEQLTTSSAVTGDFFEDSLKYSYGGFQAENEELGETSYAEDVPALQRAEAGMEVEDIEQAYKKKEDQFMTLVVDDATLFRLAPELPAFVEMENTQLAGYTSLKFNFVENPEMEQKILSYAIDVVDDKDDETEEPEFKEGDVRNRLFNVEFDDWAEQEMLTHGKDVSFKEWADEESESHGDEEFMDWAKHEEESHDERYEADEATRTQFDLQMEDWLEFVWANKDNPKFASRKGSQYKLYEAWKRQSPLLIENKCLIPYDEAIPEMHIFLDYMEDMEREAKKQKEQQERKEKNREYQRKYWRKRKANWTEEDWEEERRKQNAYRRERWANRTDEEREEYNRKRREYMSKYRRKIRANWTDEEREEHNRKQREYMRERYANMTDEEREEYNRKQREYMARKKKNEKEEISKLRERISELEGMLAKKDKSEGFEFMAEWRNLSDFEMGDRDRYALGDEIIAISQTLRENKVDDWRAVKKLGKAIKQGKFTRVRDEMGNIGIYSRRAVWDKHHKDFFELFSDSQIQALGIPWVVNDYRAEITDEDLSELESKLDRKIDSYVKGLNYTQCVACNKEAKVEILEDKDGNAVYHFYSCECGHNDIQDSSYDAESANKYQLMAEEMGGRYRVRNNRGFNIEFENGYELSVMIGAGTYSDNYDMSPIAEMGRGLESSTAEIAVIHNGLMLPLDEDGHFGSTVIGYVPTSVLPSLIKAVSNGDNDEIRNVVGQFKGGDFDAETFEAPADGIDSLRESMKKKKEKLKELNEELEQRKKDLKEKHDSDIAIYGKVLGDKKFTDRIKVTERKIEKHINSIDKLQEKINAKFKLGYRDDFVLKKIRSNDPTANTTSESTYRFDHRYSGSARQRRLLKRKAEESDGFIGRIPKSKSMGEKNEILKNNVRIIFEEAQRPLYPIEFMALYEQKKYGDKPQRKSKYKSSPRAKKLGFIQRDLTRIVNTQPDKYYVSRRGLIHYIGEGSMQDYIKNLDPKYFAEDDSKSDNYLPDEDDILKYLEQSHRSIRKYNAPYRYSSKGMAEKFGVSQDAMRARMGRMEQAGKVKSTPRRCEDAPKAHRIRPLKIFYLPDKRLMGAENYSPSYMVDSDVDSLIDSSERLEDMVDERKEYPEWWKSQLSVSSDKVDGLADFLEYAERNDKV